MREKMSEIGMRLEDRKSDIAKLSPMIRQWMHGQATKPCNTHVHFHMDINIACVVHLFMHLRILL